MKAHHHQHHQFYYRQFNALFSSLPELKTKQQANEYLTTLCKKHLYREALEAFDNLLLQKDRDFIQIYASTYANLISACAYIRSLEHGRRIHSHIIGSGNEPDMILNNHVLNMYGKCGSLNDARKVFDNMPQRNLVSWTSVIAGCSRNGEENDAVELYVEMLLSGLLPDQFTLGSVVKACSGIGDVSLGRQLHGHMVKSEFGCHLIPQNAIIAMYIKFDLIDDAWDVFSRIVDKDLISWGSMIAGFSQLGHELEALNLFKEMLSQGVYLPNEFVFGSLLKACSNLLQLEYGRQMHGICIKFGLGKDTFAGCSLSDMYARCGFLDSARSAFYQIEKPDLASWNAILGGLANGGDVTEAMSLFSQLRHRGLIPDDNTLRSLLCACNSPSTLYQGMQVHSYIIRKGFSSNVPLCNALLTMYGNCSGISSAFNVFHDMRNNADSVSWNAILTAFVQHQKAEEVFRILKLLLVSQCKPDHITLSIIYGACVQLASLEMGAQTHCFAVKTGLVLNLTFDNGICPIRKRRRSS
ncbi:hypothetical protein ACFE04_003522 [Oxalis oulophora]